MITKAIMSAVLCAGLAMGGAAIADDGAKPSSAKPELYKESQMKPHAAPKAGSVAPDAALKRENLYKEGPQNPNAQPKDRAVNPDAPLQKKKLYQETPK